MKKESILFASYLLGSVFAQDLNKSFGDGTLPEFLMRYDVNEDGIIDEEERQAVKEERKAARKKNSNEFGPSRNITSLEERLAARNSIRERILSKRAEKFAKIAGKDGVLSLEEFTSLPPFKNAISERISSIFKRLDSDSSGDVTLEEFNSRLRDHSPLDEPRPSHGNASPSNKGVGPGNNGNGNGNGNGNEK
ncbi:hypothetical protein N8588_01725 [Akkermansiaceae bacterium]|nr:hypothetical protein [Akkermansiaceae bacterium]MDA7682884.1 hypothetical protein [Akkermansiaceae bacterium]MDB4397533.1 hypothetical protein [Akkermansiaceae bacterium]MDB4685004.1 hypothetical protein [Akkermansiaceae bacterium]MDC0306125.1 hypothetical protein [Akkermansiaceae bacterium]